MANQQKIRKILLILTLIMYCNAFSMQQKHRYDFLNGTYKPYCANQVFNLEQKKIEHQKMQMRKAQLSSWIPMYAQHIIEDIIHLCNNKRQRMDRFISNTINYSIEYSVPFIFGIILMVLLVCIWIYTVFWKHQAKSFNKIVGPQLTNKTQISLSLFAVSLLLAISVSIYGISEGSNIEKSINEFWCNFQQQNIGYLRQKNGQYYGSFIDFAFQINKFTTFVDQKYSKIKQYISKLQKQKSLSQFYQIDNQSRNFIQQMSQKHSYLQNMPVLIDNITRLLHNIVGNQTSSLIYFNDTLEYERQVIIGFSYIKGNFDKYGNKIFGLANISAFFANSSRSIFIITVIVSMTSLFAIFYIISRQKFKEIYYKYIIQYVLGVICFICLFSAIFNSAFIVVFNAIRQTSEYSSIGNNPRNQFITAGSLNDPLIEIMVSFWPQSSGNMSYYGNATFINHLFEYDVYIEELNKQSIKDLVSQKQNETYVSKVDSLIKSFTKINEEFQVIRDEMLNPQGLQKLDPTAFGRNVLGYISCITTNTFNRCFEHRKIFGYLSLFLIMGIISSASINFSYKSYIRTQQVDNQTHFQDEQHDKGNGRKLSQDQIGLSNQQ